MRRHPAALELRVATRQRRPNPNHDVSERAQLRSHLLGRPWFEEDRAQPDRRLRRAHLLEHRELERALRRDDPAVVHPYPPRLPRRRSTASARRSSGTVSEMRKKPSPLGPYELPGETTTPDSSSTSSQYDAEVCPSGTGAQT